MRFPLWERLIYRLFLSVLPSHTYAITQKQAEALEKWLEMSHDSDGLKAYFVARDYALLKEMGMGVDEKRYPMLVGRRMELLSLMGEAKSAFDRKQVEKKKK